MDGQDPRRLARLRIEERITEIRYWLTLGEATGSKASEVPGAWDLEEELLDELAELECALFAEDAEPHAPWSRSSKEGVVDRRAEVPALRAAPGYRIRKCSYTRQEE